MSSKYLVPGLRTPFVKAGGAYARHDTIALSVRVAQAMAAQAKPDFVIWGQVIPSATVSNLAREIVLEAGLDPEMPAFSTVMACSTSMMAAIQAAGLVGHSDFHLALVGGAETMSRAPIALKPDVALKVANLLADPAAAIAAFAELEPRDFALPAKGWANRISGRSMGDHTEDTVKHFAISRADQDRIALLSHQRTIAAQDRGFFDDLIVPFAGVDRDMLARRDTTADKLASLKPVFDPTSAGSLTAGNSSPLTDGAAGLWVADEQGLQRLGNPAAAAKLVDWQIASMDHHPEGLLMAPARAIPRLLARHGLAFADIDLWEIHEAFAGQVLANIKAFTDPAYRQEKAGVTADLGDFPWDRLNPNGGSLAIGHPFAATGARIISQAVKDLTTLGSGTRAVISICADGGQGTVLLIEAV